MTEYFGRDGLDDQIEALESSMGSASAIAAAFDGELRRIVLNCFVDAQTPGRIPREEGVDTQRRQEAAGVVGKGELLIR